MAFAPKNFNRNTNQDTSDETTTDASTDLEFLKPAKNAAKDFSSDPYSAELTQKSAFQYTLKTLNALKIVSPLISALMVRPGVDAPNDQISDSFKYLIKEISTGSEAICDKMNVDPTKEKNFWIRNVIEKNLADIIHDQWIKEGKVNISTIVESMATVVEFSENVAEKNIYDEFPEKELLSMACMKSMMPVINEAHNNFSLYRDMEKDIDPIMTKLFETSAKAVDKIADDYADSKDRAKLFSMIIQEAGTLYASSWHAEGKRISEIMEKMPKERYEEALEKHKQKGGLPLAKVESDFDKYFTKMLAVTQKLVVSQKSGLDKKLKK